MSMISSFSPFKRPEDLANLTMEYMKEPETSKEGAPIKVAAAYTFFSPEHIRLLTNIFRTNVVKYDGIPAQFVEDPVTYEQLGSDCVITICGHTFNRTTIAQVTQCPFDRTPLTVGTVRPNLVVSCIMSSISQITPIDKIVKIFIEVADSKMPLQKTANGLAAFNKELYLRTFSLNERRIYNMAAIGALQPFLPLNKHDNKRVVAPCGLTLAKEVFIRGGFSGCCATAHSIDMCVPNRLLEEQMEWAKKYTRSSAWAMGDPETLPGKAGIFLHVRPKDTPSKLVRVMAAEGVFSKAVQMICATDERAPAMRFLESIKKFENLEEMINAMSSLSLDFSIQTSKPVLYTKEGVPLPPDQPFELFPRSGPIGEEGYVHMVLARDKTSFCAPDLLKLLEKTDAS
jgi:hypothetical protein